MTDLLGVRSARRRSQRHSRPTAGDRHRRSDKAARAAPRRRVAARRHGGGVADAVERGGQRRAFDEARVGDRHRRAAGEEVEARGLHAREGGQRRLGLADAGSDEGGASTRRCATTTPTSVGNIRSDEQQHVAAPHQAFLVVQGFLAVLLVVGLLLLNY